MRGRASESMGMDSGWFGSFIEAFFDSIAATRLPIWRVFQRDEQASTAFTIESSWQEAWSRCRELREQDPASSYMVHHAIARLGVG